MFWSATRRYTSKHLETMKRYENSLQSSVSFFLWSHSFSFCLSFCSVSLFSFICFCLSAFTSSIVFLLFNVLSSLILYLCLLFLLSTFLYRNIFCRPTLECFNCPLILSFCYMCFFSSFIVVISPFLSTFYFMFYFPYVSRVTFLHFALRLFPHALFSSLLPFPRLHTALNDVC